MVRRGDLGEAEADAREALVIADTWGTSARFAGHAIAFLVDALIEQGKLDDAARVPARAKSGTSLGGGRPRLPVGGAFDAIALARKCRQRR